MSKIDLEPLVCLKRARIDVERGNCEYNVTDYLDTIEVALLELKEIKETKAYIEKIKTMLKQKDCALRYIESEDCFAVKTILSDGWYKLTPEFVDNNVREEVKPLPLIQKNVQLREENAKYQTTLENLEYENKMLIKENVRNAKIAERQHNALNIIKEKNVEMALFNDSKTVEDYNSNRNLGAKELTKEEFDFLKEVFD